MTDCPRDNYFNRQISSSVFGEMPHMHKYSAIYIHFFLIAPKHQIPLLQVGLKAGFEFFFFFLNCKSYGNVFVRRPLRSLYLLQSYFPCDAERGKKQHLILFRQTRFFFLPPSSVCLLAVAAEESAALTSTPKDGIIWLFKENLPTALTTSFKAERLQ